MQLTYRHLLRESAPIAGLLFVWYALGALVAPVAGVLPQNILPIGFRTVGIATATVFALVRGVAIARGTDPFVLSGDFRELLRESVVVAVPVFVWVGLATVVTSVARIFDVYAYSALFVAVFVQTALATAGLYVVVRIVPVLRSELGSDRTAVSSDD